MTLVSSTAYVRTAHHIKESNRVRRSFFFCFFLKTCQCVVWRNTQNPHAFTSKEKKLICWKKNEYIACFYFKVTHAAFINLWFIDARAKNSSLHSAPLLCLLEHHRRLIQIGLESIIFVKLPWLTLERLHLFMVVTKDTIMLSNYVWITKQQNIKLDAIKGWLYLITLTKWTFKCCQSTFQ